MSGYILQPRLIFLWLYTKNSGVTGFRISENLDVKKPIDFYYCFNWPISDLTICTRHAQHTTLGAYLAREGFKSDPQSPKFCLFSLFFFKKTSLKALKYAK
jgi:hypothetical protein